MVFCVRRLRWFLLRLKVTLVPKTAAVRTFQTFGQMTTNPGFGPMAQCINCLVSSPCIWGIWNSQRKFAQSFDCFSQPIGTHIGGISSGPFLSGYIFLNMLNMRTFCFPVRFQRAVLQYLGKVANLIIGEANDPP